ncbi:MAG: hypothetical protein ABJN40_13800 [Sneathiella sp.]
MKPMNLNDIRFSVQILDYRLHLDPLIEDLEDGRSHGSLLMDLMRIGQKSWAEPEDDGGPDPARFHCVGPDEKIDRVIAANRGSVVAAVVTGIGNWLRRSCGGDDHELLEKILQNLDLEDRAKKEGDDELLGQEGTSMLTFRYLNTLQMQLQHICRLGGRNLLSLEEKKAFDTNIRELDGLISEIQGRLYKAFWERFPFPDESKVVSARDNTHNWIAQPNDMTDEIARTFSRRVIPAQAGPTPRVQKRQCEEKKGDREE